jgi:hypothetical protein
MTLTLGLFTGMAIIMIFEIFELSYDILLNLWTYATSRDAKKKRKSPRKI